MGDNELIRVEELEEVYDIKWEGTTEEVLSELCALMASICAELKAEPTDLLYDIAMNFIPAYPNAREQMLGLSGWLRDAAEKLVESEGVLS